MGGGGGPTQTSSTIPPWAQGYHKELLGRAAKEAYGQEEMPLYGNERIAGFSPGEASGQEHRSAMLAGGDPYTPRAMGGLQQAHGTLQQAYGTVGGPGGSLLGQFGQEQAQQYMSPYMQNVVDVEQQAAQREFERQQNLSDAERVAGGSRGGYREAIGRALAGSEQARVAGEIQSRGSQAAYLNAQEQFQRDREAAMGQAGLYSEQAGLYSDIGMRTSELGGMAQAQELERIKAAEYGGEQQRAMQQAKMNLGYEDFMRQQQWPMTQMNWMSGMLSGIPHPAGQWSSSPGPGFMNQLISLGLGGAGISQLLGGGGVGGAVK